MFTISIIIFTKPLLFFYSFLLARLDGINKPMKHTTIEDYLQMDGWEPPPSSSNGKKRVSSISTAKFSQFKTF